MPAKKTVQAAGSSVYVVVVNNTVNSVFATQEAAQEHVDSTNGGSVASTTARVEVHTLKGGSITPVAIKNEVKEEQDDNIEPEAPKAKAKGAKRVKGEDDDEPKGGANGSKIKTQTSKAKATEDTLPANVKALLNSSGSALAGLAIVVTGVPPTLGRQNAERLVMNHGGKLAKSISKNTNYVVVGRDAGPKKLQQIEDLGIQTLDEDAFIGMIEGGDAGGESGPPAAKKVKR